MKTSSILGAGSLLFGKRKYKIIFVGLQFAYLAYKLMKENQKSDSVDVKNKGQKVKGTIQ